MAPLDDVELMEERAELTAREFDELGQHRTAAYHRTEFIDNEQEDSDLDKKTLSNKKIMTWKTKNLLIKKTITNKSKVFKENY
ncbi:hypothetical protein BASA81_017886 [Batrachochytrium salamandrivorans]|nr:hypothetical protein BASA81_017886 [Batrachochytrium salamandrivorans]